MIKNKPQYQDIELQNAEVIEAVPDEPKNNLNLDIIADVEVSIDVKIGDANLSVAQLNTLEAGQAFKLNQVVNEPVQLILNNKIIGIGKLVVIENQFGVELIKINT